MYMFTVVIQIDKEWMQKLIVTSRERKNSLSEQLMNCWNTVVNPFSTTLHILENIYMFETGKF